MDIGPLLGAWVNYDQDTTGILRVESTRRGDDLVLRPYGASGTPGADGVDWGEVVGAAFAIGVGDHEAVGFMAEFRHDFATVALAAYLNKRLLVVDAYTRFTDGSGRANYFQRDHLYTMDPLPEVAP
jgi:hypothetical protein